MSSSIHLYLRTNEYFISCKRVKLGIVKDIITDADFQIGMEIKKGTYPFMLEIPKHLNRHLKVDEIYKMIKTGIKKELGMVGKQQAVGHRIYNISLLEHTDVISRTLDAAGIKYSIIDEEGRNYINELRFNPFSIEEYDEGDEED